MYDAFNNDQYYILYQLDRWHDSRTSQNIFIDYRSWSGIIQTLSMYINQSNLKLSDVLILTPIQADAVELTRHGMWAESFLEYVYESGSIEEDFIDIIGHQYKGDLNNLQKIRESILYRHESQSRPKLVIILNAELLTPKQLSDANKLLHVQTIVCFDSAKFYSQDSLVNHVAKPIKHTFLNEDTTLMQKFLYSMLEKRMVPLAKDSEVRVYEYTRSGHDLNKMVKPVISCDPEYGRNIAMRDNKIVKCSLVYTNNYNWNYSLEDDRYYLIKGIYLYIDTISKRGGVIRVTSHPTYSKFKFKVVPDVQYAKVTTPCYIDDLPAWSFSKGSILIPKILKTIYDARRVYNAVNMFTDQISVYVL